MEKRLILVNYSDIVKTNQSVWLIRKKYSNVPIKRLKDFEMKSILSNSYKYMNNLINYNNKSYFINKHLLSVIEKFKKNYDLKDFGLSYAEFIYPEFIDNTDFKLNLKRFKNKKITALTNNTELYKNLDNRIIEEAKKLNVGIDIIYKSKSLFDKVDHSLTILEKMIGYSVIDNEFVDVIDCYNKVEIFDSNKENLYNYRNMQTIFNSIFYNSTKQIQEKILLRLKSLPYLKIVEMTNNDFNPFIKETLILKKPTRIHRYKNFNK